MINFKRLLPTPVRHCIFAAFLFIGSVVAFSTHLDNKLDNMRATNSGLLNAYLAWDESEAKDVVQLKPLYDKAKEGNAVALILLSSAQRRVEPQPSIDEALIGFYRTAPDYMLGHIDQLEHLYSSENRAAGESFNTSLSAAQTRSLAECAARLQSSGRYEHLVSTKDDQTFSLWFKHQVALINVGLDDLGIRESICNDLPV